MVDETGIDALLDLGGQIIDQEGDYLVKIEAWRADSSPAIPHGIRYSLTLHNACGTRVMEFDNAHAVRRPRQDRYAGRIMTYDHQHHHTANKGVPYEPQDAYQLMKDCFAEVDKTIQEASL
ncbi:MAG: toxin-antitoxin system TumE family protein [Acidiferrobacter sp.]